MIIAGVSEFTRELLRQQDRLQAEASAAEGDLELAALLTPIGHPVRVGSAALALMVWRDLDVTVICTELVHRACHRDRRPPRRASARSARHVPKRHGYLEH